MKKVVYNACYGRFGLSDLAMDRMVELGYIGLQLTPNYNPYFNFKYYGDDKIPRHNKILVQVVEELGELANGMGANLKITCVDGPYRIDEYDGMESVETPDSYDWIYPEEDDPLEQRFRELESE